MKTGFIVLNVTDVDAPWPIAPVYFNPIHIVRMIPKEMKELKAKTLLDIGDHSYWARESVEEIIQLVKLMNQG